MARVGLAWVPQIGKLPLLTVQKTVRVSESMQHEPLANRLQLTVAIRSITEMGVIGCLIERKSYCLRGRQRPRAPILTTTSCSMLSPH